MILISIWCKNRILMIVINAPHLKVKNLSANFTLLVLVWYTAPFSFLPTIVMHGVPLYLQLQWYCNKEHQSVTLCDCVISTSRTSLVTSNGVCIAWKATQDHLRNNNQQLQHYCISTHLKTYHSKCACVKISSLPCNSNHILYHT